MSYHTKLQEAEFFNSMRQPFDNDEEMIKLYLSVMTDCAYVPRDLDTSFLSEQDLEPFPVDYSSASRSAMARVTTATLPYDYSAIPSIRQPRNIALPTKHLIVEKSKTPPGVLFKTAPQDLDTISLCSLQDVKPSPIDYSLSSKSSNSVTATMPNVTPHYDSAIASMGSTPGVLFTSQTASQPVPYQTLRYPNLTFEVGRTELPPFTSEGMDRFAEQVDNTALPAKHHNMEASKTPPHDVLRTAAPQDLDTILLWSLQDVKPSSIDYSSSFTPSNSIAATMQNATPHNDSTIPSMGPGGLLTSLTASHRPVPYQTLRYPNLSFEVGRTELDAFSSEGMDCFDKKQADFQPQADGCTANGVARSQQQQQQHPSAHPSNMGFQAPPPTTIKNTKTSSCVLKNSARKKAKLLKASSGAPFRPLSPYNYFFRDERERLLLQQDHLDSGVVVSNLSPAKAQQLLFKQWNRDKTAKRAHRKSHGKISFETLTVSIAAAWGRLGAHEKAFYKAVSDKDWARYRAELHVYKTMTLADQKIGADGTEQGV